MVRRIVVFGLFGLGLVTSPLSVTLYDGTGLAMPHQAPWAWTLGGAGGTLTPPAAGSVFTRLDTTASTAIQEGWLQISPFVLDRQSGYDVSFDLRINAEAHGSANRAGLSVIVLSSDKRGIELSFWTNEIWAQADSPLFTHGEGAAFDTTGNGSGVGGLLRYRLRVAGNGYTLYAEGQSLLAGSLRDYSAFTGTPDPYETPNFLWVGDNAQSSSSISDFSRFEVAVVPEPLTWGALVMGLAALASRRRNAEMPPE